MNIAKLFELMQAEEARLEAIISEIDQDAQKLESHLAQTDSFTKEEVESMKQDSLKSYMTAYGACMTMESLFELVMQHKDQLLPDSIQAAEEMVVSYTQQKEVFLKAAHMQYQGERSV